MTDITINADNQNKLTESINPCGKILEGFKW